MESGRLLKNILNNIQHMKNLFVTVKIIFLISVTTQAQWIQTNGPFGAKVTALATDGTFCYTGTESRGIYRSIAGSGQWAETNNGLGNHWIKALSCNAALLLAGTDGGGIYRSTDYGASWSAMNTGISDLVITDIVFCGSQIFASTYGQVYTTIVSDTVWNPVSTLSGFPVLTLASDGVNIFAGTATAGAFISSDLGLTWDSINTGMNSPMIYEIESNGTTLYAGTPGNVFFSTDYGQSWNPTGAGIVSSATAFGFLGNYVFAGTVNGCFFYNGTSWYSTGNAHHVTSLLGIGTEMLAGSLYEGVQHTSDTGATWSYFNNGITGIPVQTLLSSGSTLFAGTAGNGIFQTTDAGLTWSPSNTGINISSNFSIGNLTQMGSKLFAASYTGYVSDNAGASWNSLTGLSMQPLEFAVMGSKLFAATTPPENVSQSSDSGTTWILANNGIYGPDISCLAVLDTMLFAGTAPSQGIFRTVDNGNNWIQVNTGLTDLHITALTVLGTNIYAGTDEDGIFKSVNGGASWTAVNNGLGTDLTILSLFSHNTVLLAATEDGVYKSYDGGANWINANSGLSINLVTSFAAVGNILYAGTQLGGVFADSLILSNVIENNHDRLDFQIFPNPASELITLKLTSSEKNSCTIFSPEGKELYRITVNADLLHISTEYFAPGIYILKVETESNYGVKKLLITK
jgi:photosystem II stability/assembly factor-like uncharacterized protein